MMQLLSVKETAKRFHLSERRIQALCESNRIEGAQMISGVWLIPSTAQRPTDERTLQTDENEISLSQLCNILSISTATGRNWVKLGKLTPVSTLKQTPVFSKAYVNQLKADIISGKNTALKSRRNKKYISGTSVYRSYVSDTSVNLSIVQSIVEYIECHHIEVTESFLCTILAECAIQLLWSKQNGSQTVSCLSDYINGHASHNDYLFLVDDILCDKLLIPNIINEHSDLFRFTYTYEKGEDILGLLYISLKHLGDRKATGSYYTPTNVVKKLCRHLFATNETSKKDVLDPCCGTGNFILQLPPCVHPSHIYGNDIDTLSVKITRINYALKYDISDPAILYTHFTNKDYLVFQSPIKYDYIIGNPPWGYEFSDAQKKELKKKYNSATGKNIESYDVFIEQSLASLQPNGILSFVLPEAILSVQTHTPIRQIMLHNCTFQYIEFLGNAFDKVQCPCVILQAAYTRKMFNGVGLTVKDSARKFTIQNPRHFSSEYPCLAIPDDEYCIIEKLNHITNSVTLLGKSKFALGIVTGNNKEYISQTKTDKNELVLKGSDIYKYKYLPSDHYLAFQPESFQQVAPTEYYRAEEKLLYRFICNQLVFAYDNNQTLSLNSCNILIPEIDGFHMKYIMAVLNSRPAQFYFKKNFHSVKILRSHIEQIPIPLATQELQNDIIAVVNSILINSDSDVMQKLYDELDSMITPLYGLNDAEYQIIKSSLKDENLFLYCHSDESNNH